MNLLPRRVWLCAALLSLSVAWPAVVWASVPPETVVESRLKSARQAASDLDVDIDIQTIGSDSDGISSFSMLGKRAGGEDAGAFPWKLLMVVLTSSDPWTDIENLAGSVDASTTDIATQDDAFVYAYGGNPQVAVSRDLSVIRWVRVERDLKRWELVAEGRLEGTPLPERVVVLRDGRPFVRVKLSLPETQDK